MEFKTNSGIWGTMFGVPCIVSDNFLKLATESQLKVLLYLLRHSGRSVSADEITANTGVSANEIEEAVLFWSQVNVLSSETFSAPAIMTPVSQPEPVKPAVAEKPEPPKEETPKTETRQKQYLQPADIAKLLKQSPDIAELFKITENILGPLSHTMHNSLIWMYTYLGLKKEVISILITYCKEIEKTNSGYIEKIASSWSELEINTLELATEEVQRLTESHTFIGKIKRIFEMKRNPTTKQKEFIEEWKKYNFSDELLTLAYEKTLEGTGTLTFSYLNSILVSWNENNIRTVEAAKKSDELHKEKSNYKNKVNGQSGSSDDSFDVDKYKIFINNI